MLREYEIKRAQKADAEEILRLQYIAYQSEAEIYNNDSIQPLTQTLGQAMEEFPMGVVLKAVSDGVIIGSVRACERQDGVYVGKLMVHPEYQNQGVGKRLLQAIERKFQGKRFELFTGAKSEKNLALYEKCGYRRFRTEEAAPGLTLVYMEKQAVYTREITAPEYPLLEDFPKDNLTDFLRETPYIDFSSQNIQTKAAELFSGVTGDIQKARIAYEFVRDEIPHTFDIYAKTITAKASDVLRHETGICHAKAILLAALLRSQGIPTGFCFQHITIMDDDSEGYCVHCYNAVWLDGRWVRLDARGNKPGVNAQFSLDEPVLAYPCRPRFQEFFWPGIYADPHAETMAMLEQADSVEYIIKNIPDEITLQPDVVEGKELTRSYASANTKQADSVRGQRANHQKGVSLAK